MFEVKREQSRLPKQAQPLTALVALKNTQHRRGDGGGVLCGDQVIKLDE